MIHVDDLRALKRRIATYPDPMLSAYLDVDPSRPENRGKAYVLRLKAALKRAGVPRGPAERVLRLVDEERPRGRTLVVFADHEVQPETHRLRVGLPERVRWGRPHVAPLAFALQRYEPCGVLLLDAERARFFVSTLGETEEELDMTNIFSTRGWREITIAPSTAAPGGGAATDAYEHRLEAQLHRFHKEMGETLRGLVERFGLGSLILAGPEERTAAFAATLTNDLSGLVAATVSLPLDTTEREVAEKVSAAEEEMRGRRQRDLLAEAGERGVEGLYRTLGSLQEGRVYRLLVPWPTEEAVSWCDGCSLASEGETCSYCGGSTRPRELADVSVELTDSRGARLEFVSGDGADVLRERMGGLAGLVRF